MLRSVFIASAAIVTLALAHPAYAIKVVPLSFEELVTQSSNIVYGRVIDVQGHWTDDRQSVESVITIQVLDAFKGTNPATLAIMVPGGQAGRYLNLLPGAPVFTPGDLAVLFLTARGARLPIATGFTQGVYRVSATSGQALVVPPVIEAAGAQVSRGDARRKPVTLDAFGAAIRRAIETSRASSGARRGASAR